MKYVMYTAIAIKTNIWYLSYFIKLISLPAIFKFSKLLLKISVIGKKMAIPKSSIVTQRNEDNKTIVISA